MDEISVCQSCDHYNPINLISVHSLYQQHTRVKCALTKLSGLCSQLWQAEMALIQASFQLKREHFGSSTMSHKMCPGKQTTKPKLLILISHFLRRRYLINWYYLLHPHIMGSIPFRFYWATLYTCTKMRVKPPPPPPPPNNSRVVYLTEGVARLFPSIWTAGAGCFCIPPNLS